MSRHIFVDRQEAGVQLGAALHAADFTNPVVLGLPRGGVVVAAAVADALQAPLDVIVVRKLGVPYQPELAMGALGENGVIVLNHDVIRAAHVSDHELHQVEAHQQLELNNRLRLVRAVRAQEPLVGRSAVVVDDGIATGATMRAAVQVARAAGARDVTVATPLAPHEVVEALRHLADRVVCLAQPEPFYAVGTWYQHFETVTDEEVVRLLSSAPHMSADSAPGRAAPATSEEVHVSMGPVSVVGDLSTPPDAIGTVIFAHGSGSSRHSPRNRWVAEQLQFHGMATFVVDLLTADEARLRENVFHVQMLADRLRAATDVIAGRPDVGHLPIGYFGASTGAAAALWAAADDERVVTVVSRGGRPDLAAPRLAAVKVPTLLIVGGDDRMVVELNRTAARALGAEHRLVVVPGATHLFEEPGALDKVAAASAMWFTEQFHRATSEARPPTPTTA